MLKKHLLPRFGDKAVSDVTRQEIQVYVAHLTQEGYAPKSIDHIHDVLSAVPRTAVKWGHIQDNPARGVDLPKLRTVRPKWALTREQAGALLAALPPLGKAMAGLAIWSGLRRGELFARAGAPSQHLRRERAQPVLQGAETLEAERVVGVGADGAAEAEARALVGALDTAMVISNETTL